MPLISIIIPAYNAADTIQETIESVLNQTLSDLELIVVNDGSQDSTLKIISSIKDTRIKVFSQLNAGSNYSRNRGLLHANSEYISFLDADDLWTPDKLEAQLKILEANPQASVAYSWTNCIDESSQFLRRGTYITAVGEVYAKLLVVNFLESGSNPLIRRDALSTVGGFDESLPAGQDWDLYLRLARHHHFVAVPSAQVLYRVSGNSLSANVIRQETACLTVIERAFNQAPESLQYLKPFSLANIYKYLIYKALYGPPERHKSLLALRFLWHAVGNDLSLFQERVFIKLLLQIAVPLLLPPQQAHVLLTKIPRISNTSTILGYLQLDPF